jgi:Bardet-Biedl syndrome 2 protein
MIFDINEDSKVQFLTKIQKTMFAYALSNGKIGVYSGTASKWNTKVDNKVSALLGVDFEKDGDWQLMVGYQSGKFEVRTTSAGNCTYTANMGSTISKIMYEDYRMEGNKQVIVCNTDGDVKGFTLTQNASAYETTTQVVKKDNDAISKMNLEIHKLKAELDDDNFQKREEDSAALASVVPSDIECKITQSTTDSSS